MNFKRVRNIALLMIAGFPLAIIGNVTRLLVIIIVSEAFGQKWGNYVHDSSIFSLLPYVPPIIGVIVLGHFLREDKTMARTYAGTPEPETREEDVEERDDEDDSALRGKREVPVTR